jgi:hypothetical protein
LEESWQKEIFPKLGAVISGMNCMELLKYSVNKNSDNPKPKLHTFVLGVCFESSPQGTKKFRIMIMEEKQLRKCLGGDDPEVYRNLKSEDPKENEKLKVYHGCDKTEGCTTPLPHQREDRLRVMRIMANLWFNSNGGEDVKLKDGDEGLISFKLKRVELRKRCGSNSAELKEQLKSFFEKRAQAFSMKKDLQKMGPLDLFGLDAQNAAKVRPEWVPSMMKKKKRKSQEDEQLWQYDYFFSRLVVIDRRGGCHKLEETVDSTLIGREYKWDKLAQFLDYRKTFKDDEDSIRARLTPVTVQESDFRNRLLHRDDPEDCKMRGARGLTSIDVYGLED